MRIFVFIVSYLFCANAFSQNQIPEKPDYWCSCGQCERNIDRVDDIIEEVVKSKKGIDNE